MRGVADWHGRGNDSYPWDTLEIRVKEGPVIKSDGNVIKHSNGMLAPGFC